MKVEIIALLLAISATSEGGKRRKCYQPRRNKSSNFVAPFKLGYEFQNDLFQIPNFSDGNQIVLREPGYDYDLTPRFRNGVANINPIQAVSCESSNVTSSLKELRQQVKCVPRDGIVHLKAPEGFMVSPNTVMVKKCGGMCNGAKSCLSRKTREAQFFVRSVNVQTNEVVCSSIQVPEDISCSCGCETKLTDCLPTQKYDKNMCTCKCVNLKDYQNCVSKSRMNFKWDEKSCSCACSTRKICTTGSHWIESECRCAKVNT